MSFDFVYVTFLAAILLGSPKPHQNNNEQKPHETNAGLRVIKIRSTLSFG
jgi:hypothetical protein